ncbi:unnamed protein product [Rotaria sp. Silwood1]|nr:unnamed protein product [Rotaria sp. Silwood1]
MVNVLDKEGDIHCVTERGDVRVQFYVFDENNQDLSSSIAQQTCWIVHPSALTKIHSCTFGDQVMIYRDEQQQCTTDGDPILHYACLGNQPNCVSLLLSKGADNNLIYSTACLCLQIAINKQLLECTKRLLEHQQSLMNVHLKDTYRDIALRGIVSRISGVLNKQCSIMIHILVWQSFGCNNCSSLNLLCRISSLLVSDP